MFETIGRHSYMYVLEDMLTVLVIPSISEIILKSSSEYVLANVTLANVSRPSKTRSTLAAVRSFSETMNVFLNAQSVSPIPVSH